MMGSTFWAYFKYFLPYQTPFLLLWVVGLILSIHFRQRNPKKFGFASIAFAVFLIGTIGGIVASSMFYEIIATSAKTVPEMTYRLIYWIPYWVPIATNVIAWVILLKAIFNRKMDLVSGN